MANPSRQIGGIEVFKTLNSTKYEQNLYVPELELVSLTPEIGDPAPWAPVDAQITGISKTWIANESWLLQLTAEPAEALGFTGSYQKKNLDDYVEKSFTVSDIHFHYEWWGIRIAAHTDTSIVYTDTDDERELKYLNIYGDWAAPGDYIFRNASLRVSDADGNILADELIGTPQYTRSPFLDNSTLEMEMIGQILKTRVYCCSFNTRREPHKISHFVGVSGNFAKSCSPGGNIEGKWKALSQTIRKLRSPDGKTYTNVIRSMIEAPNSLRWDPGKNGGVWIW